MIGVQIKRSQSFSPLEAARQTNGIDRTTCNLDTDNVNVERVSARGRYNVIIWERVCDSNAMSETFNDESDLPWYIRDRLEVSESRNTSRVQSESREAMYARAMKLLTARCTSVQPGMETPFGISRHELPFGVQIPQYFYIRQEKPTPMPPLKAWQGYNGNVYFEPIQISSVRDQKETSQLEKSSDLHRMFTSPQKQLPSIDRPDSQMTRSFSRSTGKTTGSPKSGNRPLTRQMVLLDKRIVLDRYDDDITGDLQWIEGMEHTGSLNVRPKSEMLPDRPLPPTPKPPKQEQGKKTVYNKERICKGSVVHKLNLANKSNQPIFKVSGGKYSTPTNTSPLLRRQTQYSLSSQRLTTNTPDISSHLYSSDMRRSGNRPVTYSEDTKPFIKYSAEVKSKAGVA
ncbi:hypothetical protein FSP39_005027 [Pinctada imbricata]|uniref:Uncharacterized protein n=1 Tax=Pinctada imbricata TaxID=66713 RepID=A0AA88Y7E4_PINIB|nr:hypothetical protein FSP39_005027 [Pinctada imbricata]